ncbi:calcium/sodium antiporter [Candidatus Gottesmanbacteria bacterium]|nr:calcium/sodium antiporter [Candidatus Gottesmanbacteria bacterium]
MEVFITFLLIIFSILLMGKGSDWLTDSLIPIARKLGVTGSFVGLILVSAAVSLPEILVALFTSFLGYPAISIGVILGSIVCNIGFMTGLSAFVRPLKVNSRIILRDGLFSIVVPILVFAVGSGGEISRLEGFAFLLLFLPYVVNVYLHEKDVSKQEKIAYQKEIEVELELAGFEFGNLKPGWLTFVLGLALLLGGAQLFGNQLIHIVSTFGINEILIGITLGAIGPSIPNIITSYQAAKRGLGEIAVSETLGSNIFTLLVTLGLTAILSPISVSARWLQFDLPAMLIMSFLLFIFIITQQTVTRLEGVFLMGGYLFILLLQVMINTI